MTTITRRSRRRMSAPDSLAAAWDRGEAPPAWASKPGDHHQELIELYFFGTPADWQVHRHPREHPHHAAWRDAFKASKPEKAA